MKSPVNEFHVLFVFAFVNVVLITKSRSTGGAPGAVIPERKG